MSLQARRLTTLSWCTTSVAGVASRITTKLHTTRLSAKHPGLPFTTAMSHSRTMPLFQACSSRLSNELWQRSTAVTLENVYASQSSKWHKEDSRWGQAQVMVSKEFVLAHQGSERGPF